MYAAFFVTYHIPTTVENITETYHPSPYQIYKQQIIKTTRKVASNECELTSGEWLITTKQV